MTPADTLDLLDARIGELSGRRIAVLQEIENLRRELVEIDERLDELMREQGREIEKVEDRDALE